MITSKTVNTLEKKEILKSWLILQAGTEEHQSLFYFIPSYMRPYTMIMMTWKQNCLIWLWCEGSEHILLALLHDDLPAHQGEVCNPRQLHQDHRLHNFHFWITTPWLAPECLIFPLDHNYQASTILCYYYPGSINPC